MGRSRADVLRLAWVGARRSEQESTLLQTILVQTHFQASGWSARAASCLDSQPDTFRLAVTFTYIAADASR